MKKHELTVVQAAEALGVGTPYVYILLRNKQLVGWKNNGEWRISARSVEARKHKGANHARRN